MTPRLPITLDRESGIPLYRQIEAQLRRSIEAGRLPAGRRLPSVRALATQLGIGRLTVATAYEQLAADGYVVGRMGSATLVAPNAPRALPATLAAPTPRTRTAVPDIRLLDGLEPSFRAPTRPVGHDLRPARGAGAGIVPNPVLERLLRDAWRDVTTGVERRGGEDRAGDERLRTAIATHLSATRGAGCDARRVVVVSGALLGVAAVIRARFARDGGAPAAAAPAALAAAVEDPGDAVLRGALALAGAHVVPVPVDRNGMQAALLPSGADLVVAAPTVQVPTGSSMPLARRLQLLAWAGDRGALVIEDGRADELRFAGEPLGCLQAMDDGDAVVHLGSFEAILHDGVRIGYLVLPEALVDPVVATLEAVDPGPTLVQQAALARFITDGHFDRHLERMRRALAGRMDAAVESVRESLGWLATVEPVFGGTRLIVTVEDPAWSARLVSRVAARAGVAIEPLAPARIGAGPDRELVIDVARALPGELRAAIRLLASALRSASPTVEGPAVRVLPGSRAAVPSSLAGWSGRPLAAGLGRDER